MAKAKKAGPGSPVKNKRKKGRRLGKGEDGVAVTDFEHAVGAILKRVRVDRRWDIPYLAGYSRAGRTIYIDRDVPKTFRQRKKRVRVDPFLIVHEAVEIALLDKLDLAYQDAHHIALLAERSAVEAAGVDWDAYHRFMMEHIKRVGNKKLRRVPRRLNLTPYFDEQDLPLLHEMLPLMYGKWKK